MVEKKAVVPAVFFQTPSPSAGRIEQLIERINAGRYEQVELANLYDNARERDLGDVMAAIEQKMRADFPRAATRKFGAVKKPGE